MQTGGMPGCVAAAEAEETQEDAGLKCRSLNASQRGFGGCVFSFFVVHKIAHRLTAYGA